MNFDLNNIISSFQNLASIITFETFLKGLALYFFVFWIAIIIWVTKDIINRTNNILLQILSIFTVLFLTPLGVVIYLLIRPSKTILEKYYEQGNFEPISEDISLEDIEEDSCEENIIQNNLKCFSCGFAISSDFHFCPNCKIALKKECSSCHKELNAEWKICPYCGKEEEKVSKEEIKKEVVLEEEKK
ncbi:MAG: zinc ribbon domain-containing protein [Candidatus Gracilibacteria bacterium]|nr:zinc ribbon domain-containing protein [Candidatus Gracilibacteria bacterium]